MRNIFFAAVFSFLLLSPVLNAQAQSSSTETVTASPAFDMTGFPQWAKDMRRWDIVAFGSFPFSIFAATFFTDLARWNNANGMDFSEEGRRYAPWPLKSAGGIEMTKQEFERTLLIAAGISAAVAFTDLIIVLIKRNKERRRIESRGAGTAVIDITPALPDEEVESEGEADVEDGSEAADENISAEDESSPVE